MVKGVKGWAPLAISLVALFATLGGVGWADSLISGTTIKQNSIPLNRLTKSARKSLAAKRGPTGAPGSAGAPGLAGAQGLVGPQGQFQEVVPSGKTLVGTYAERYQASSGYQTYVTAISFGFRLPSAPAAHFVALGTTPPTECPGNGLNPQAAPGNLCVYETSKSNRYTPTITDVNFGPGASPFGANVVVTSELEGQGGSSGSWAVTAP